MVLKIIFIKSLLLFFVVWVLLSKFNYVLHDFILMEIWMMINIFIGLLLLNKFLNNKTNENNKFL